MAKGPAVCTAKAVHRFLSYFKRLSIGPSQGIEPANHHSAVKRPNEWASPAQQGYKKIRITRKSAFSSKHHVSGKGYMCLKIARVHESNSTNNERLPFVWKTRKFRGEFKCNGSSRWKFSGKKVMPFEVLLFYRFCRNDRNFLYHLFGSLVPGFMSRESEKFTGIL